MVLCLASIDPALAWWGPGHMQIAALAYEGLDPEVRATVDLLIQRNPKYLEWTRDLPDADKSKIAFVRAATWADDIKSDPEYDKDNQTETTPSANVGYADKFTHYYWHYVNIPFSTDESEVAPPDMPNALTQAREMMKVLTSDASSDLKSYGLVWLIHLVGDLHQPLHATTRFSEPLADDGGGSEELVQPVQGPATKLHLYWDGLLGDRISVAEAIEASRHLPRSNAADGAVLDPALWAIESFAIAQNDAYTAIIGEGPGPFELTEAYEEHALVVAEERAALAGARLANLLNRSLKKP